MRTGIIFWLLVAGYMLAGAASVINLLYGKEGFVKIGKFIRRKIQKILDLFKEKEFTIFGPIQNAYIMDCGFSDLHCIEIKDIKKNKIYIVSMKKEHVNLYNIFSRSVDDQNTRYRIVCTKRFIFENAEFVKRLL
jgi:hypothetical protein